MLLPMLFRRQGRILEVVSSVRSGYLRDKDNSATSPKSYHPMFLSSMCTIVRGSLLLAAVIAMSVALADPDPVPSPILLANIRPRSRGIELPLEALLRKVRDRPTRQSEVSLGFRTRSFGFPFWGDAIRSLRKSRWHATSYLYI